MGRKMTTKALQPLLQSSDKASKDVRQGDLILVIPPKKVVAIMGYTA